MENKKKIKLLSIYRGIVDDNRGTPIKVRSLSREFAQRDDIAFTLCAWDDEGVLEFPNYFHLTNDHLDDLKKIYAYIKKNNIDVVMGHTMATYYYLLPLKYLTKAKIVLEMQGYMEEEARFYRDINMLSYHLSKMIYGLFYRVCDLIIASSETSAAILSRYNKNVISIWGGVDISIFHPRIPGGNFLKKNPGEIIIGYAGNARIWQGLPFLLGVYAELTAKYPEFKLAILSSQKKKMETHGVIYIDQIAHEKVPLFFADCDILVVPRMHNEVNRISFPSKLIEYMAMGKAVVVSATSDAHRIVKNNKDGLVFEPGDKDALINDFLYLRDPATRERLGQEAWKTVQNRYTWKHQADLFVESLKSLFE